MAHTSPCGSCGLPGAQGRRATSRPYTDFAPAWPCSRWGLPGRRHHCQRRWSLTPPFHPYPIECVHGKGTFTIPSRPGGPFLWSFPWVSPPGCYPAPCSVERGLSSGGLGHLRSPGRPISRLHHTFQIHHRQPQLLGQPRFNAE